MSDDIDGWVAIGELYHRYLTGLLLALVTRQGTARAAEVVFRTFRRQHLELFLPGLRKLELDGKPHAVACAQYHVLSNALGGVRVVWIPESDTKSWVRYVPPRWIFDGTAVCGIPTEVSRAMLHGWHGHNGVSLGNDRLGFVCTMQTTDGQPGLEGYYIEEDRALAPEERVRFRPGERPANEPVELARPGVGPAPPRQGRTQLRDCLHPQHPPRAVRGARARGRRCGRHDRGAPDRHAVPRERDDGRSGPGVPSSIASLGCLRAHGDDVDVVETGTDTVVRLARSSLLDDLGLPG